MDPSVSPDGDRILFTTGTYDTDMLELPLDGSPPRPVLATSRSESSPSWSAAGDLMAFITDRSGEPEIWLRSLGGGWERPVLRKGNFANASPQRPGLSNVALSPDGERVAFTQPGKQWVAPVSGGRASPAAVGDDVATAVPSWSPDSSSITYLAFSGGRPYAAVARIGSQQPQFLVPGTAGQCASAPVWSPDGRWIACGGTAGDSVLLVSPDGKQRRSLPSPVHASQQGFVLVWSRDAETIYIASSMTPRARLDALNARTGASRRIAEYPPGLNFRTEAAYSLSGSLSRDSKSIATTVFNTKSDLWILEGFPQPHRGWASRK
jgi:Tol biopolymer transport system component